MGIFSCLTLLCVCLLFLSFSLSSGCLAGAARSGSACCCAKWRPAARWVWSSVFLCNFFFFFFSFPSSSPPPLVPRLRLRSEPRRGLRQEGEAGSARIQSAAPPSGTTRPHWLTLTSSCSRGRRSRAGSALPGEVGAKGENGRHDPSAREDGAGGGSPAKRKAGKGLGFSFLSGAGRSGAGEERERERERSGLRLLL